MGDVNVSSIAAMQAAMADDTNVILDPGVYESEANELRVGDDLSNLTLTFAHTEDDWHKDGIKYVGSNPSSNDGIIDIHGTNISNLKIVGLRTFNADDTRRCRGIIQSPGSEVAGLLVANCIWDNPREGFLREGGGTGRWEFRGNRALGCRRYPMGFFGSGNTQDLVIKFNLLHCHDVLQEEHGCRIQGCGSFEISHNTILNRKDRASEPGVYRTKRTIWVPVTTASENRRSFILWNFLYGGRMQIGEFPGDWPPPDLDDWPSINDVLVAFNFIDIDTQGQPNNSAGRPIELGNGAQDIVVKKNTIRSGHYEHFMDIRAWQADRPHEDLRWCDNVFNDTLMNGQDGVHISSLIDTDAQNIAPGCEFADINQVAAHEAFSLDMTMVIQSAHPPNLVITGNDAMDAVHLPKGQSGDRRIFENDGMTAFTVSDPDDSGSLSVSVAAGETWEFVFTGSKWVGHQFSDP